jgi:hypothetical protein
MRDVMLSLAIKRKFVKSSLKWLGRELRDKGLRMSIERVLSLQRHETRRIRMN